MIRSSLVAIAASLVLTACGSEQHAPKSSAQAKSTTTPALRVAGAAPPEQEADSRPACAMGRVKWFNNEKGYGFILRNTGQDVFVHHSELKNTRTLEEGDCVEFRLGHSPKGLQAYDVLVVR